MNSLYKELIEIADDLEDIAVTVERENDLSIIPKLRTERLVLQYVAEQVLILEEQIIDLNKQTMYSRRLAFYELLINKDPFATNLAKSIIGEYNFDWRVAHHLFSDEEINLVMTSLNETKGLQNGNME